jgi:hypothetical protein
MFADCINLTDITRADCEDVEPENYWANFTIKEFRRRIFIIR